MAGNDKCDRLSSLGILGEDELNSDENLQDDLEVAQFFNTQQRSPPRQVQQHPPCPFSPPMPPSPPRSHRRPYEPLGLIEPMKPTKLYGRSRLPEPLQPTKAYLPRLPKNQNYWCIPQHQSTQNLIVLEDGFQRKNQQPRPQTPLDVMRRYPLPSGPRRRRADQGVDRIDPLEGVERTSFPETGDYSCPPENIRWPRDYPFSDCPNLVAPWAAEDAAPDFDPYFNEPPEEDPCLPSTPIRRPEDENTILLELINEEEKVSPIDDLQERLSKMRRRRPYKLRLPSGWRGRVHVAPAFAKSDGYPETVDEDQEAERRLSDKRDSYQVRLREGDPISELRAEMLSRPWSERPGFPGGPIPGGTPRCTPQRPRGRRSQSPGTPTGGAGSLSQECQTAEEVRNLILQTRARLDKILKRNC